MWMIESGLLFGGISSIALGALHFPPIWGAVFTHWGDETGKLGLLHRKLINTVLVALALAVIIMGCMTLLLAKETGGLDAFRLYFLAFCALFWLWRTVWQIAYFPYGKLKPKPGLLVFHIALILIFMLNTLVYSAPVLGRV